MYLVNSILYYCFKIRTINIIIITNIAISNDIHSGLSIHSQLQVIKFVSFSVMNTIVSNPTNHIHPDELDDVFFVIMLIVISYGLSL